MREDDLKKVASKLFADHGVDRIEVDQDEDHSGTPIINVFVFHKFLDEPIQFKSLFPLDRQLRDAAWDAGETRFVHVRHRYDDKQQFAEV